MIGFWALRTISYLLLFLFIVYAEGAGTAKVHGSHPGTYLPKTTKYVLFSYLFLDMEVQISSKKKLIQFS